jgi:hypothetical protein
MSESNSNGTAAEYFVTAELSRRGYYASILLKNTPGIDILAVNTATEKMSCIQVKAKGQHGKTKTWVLHDTDEKVRGSNFFYIFVSLNNKKGPAPEYYIVPNTTVVERIKKCHKDFLANKGKDTNIRTFILKPEEEKEYQKWDRLG